MPMTEYTADAGRAVADQADDEQATAPPAALLATPIHGHEISEIAAVPVEHIDASPFNPRQTNNATADVELVESVHQVRVHAYQLGAKPEPLLRAAAHYGVELEATAVGGSTETLDAPPADDTPT